MNINYSTALQCDRRKKKQGTDIMLGLLLNLLFLACVWIAASLGFHQLSESRRDIIAALFGRGGLKRLPRRVGV
jgi:hypothetical protein